MTAHLANLINAVVLIAMSLWAYLGSVEPSLTALIPAGFGAALLACAPGVRSHNKAIAHVAVLLTLVVLVALYMPLSGALARGDDMALIRVGAMAATSVLAMVFFVKSFIDARRRAG